MLEGDITGGAPSATHEFSGAAGNVPRVRDGFVAALPIITRTASGRVAICFIHLWLGDLLQRLESYIRADLHGRVMNGARDHSSLRWMRFFFYSSIALRFSLFIFDRSIARCERFECSLSRRDITALADLG